MISPTSFGGAGGGGVDTDEKSKVSSNDTTAGYLNGKLVAGTNVTFTENNDGGNETLTIAAAGGVTGFTGSQNTASPNNTVNASRLLVDAASTDADFVIEPKGAGAILAELPDGAAPAGNKRGLVAVDFQRQRDTAVQVASGIRSFIGNGYGNRASGLESTVVNGSSNIASGSNSTICGGSTNTADNSGAAVVAGSNNTASGIYSIVGAGGSNNINSSRNYTVIGGGQSNTISTAGTHQVIGGGQSNSADATHASVVGGNANFASGNYSSVIGGQSNTANGSHSTVAGGTNNTASGLYSIASGSRALANIEGMRSHASGRFAANGDAQVQEMVVRVQTTSAAQGELTADGAAWTTTNTMQVPTDGALAFDILMVARRTDANNECAAWTIRGCIDNNAGTVAFVGTPTTTSLGDDSAGAWSVAADTEAGSVRLRVLALGQASKTINWVAHIRATRVVG
jgi:hypothetical protein